MRLIFTSVFFLLSIFVQAQHIQGKVIADGQPLPGATIYHAGSATGTVTDQEGQYQLTLSTAGEVSLEVRFAGFKPGQKSLIVKEGQHYSVDFTLEESALGLNEVVVTGTMQPTYVAASPIKVEVVNSKAVEMFLPAASASIVESVSLVNGVQEVVACGVCFTNSISINGLPGPYTAVLMDGTPMYGNLASVYGLNGIPSQIIDRIEVIKGPSSTLYGSEAVAGVINIITKDPQEQPVLSVDVMGTSHMESFGNVGATTSAGKAQGFIGLNWAYMNDFDDDNGDGFGDNINLDRYSLFTKWNFDRESGKEFSLAARYYYEDRRNGVEEFLEDRNYRELRGSEEIYGESIYTQRAELFGRYELPVSADLRLDYSASFHRQDSYYGSDGYKAEQDILFANLIYQKPLGKHSLLAGLTNRYQYYDDNTVATIDQPDRQYIPGIFIQDEWALSPDFTLLSGSRLDYYQAHGLIWAPRLNAKYTLGEYTSLRGNFGTGFRLVNLFTEDHAFVTGQRQVEIAEELQPEQSYNGSFNLNHLYLLSNQQGMFDLDLYYTYFTNKIIPDYDTPGKIIYANSEGYARSYGISLNINHEFEFPLAVNLGGMLQRVTQTEPNAEGKMETTAIEMAPEWSGLLTTSYYWKQARLTAAYTARITGPMQLPEVYDLNAQGEPLANPRPTSSEPFVFQNIQLTKVFSERFSVYGGVQNLFDYRQRESPLSGFNDPANPPGFSPYFDAAYAYSTLHGREFYLGLKWNLPK